MPELALLARLVFGSVDAAHGGGASTQGIEGIQGIEVGCC